MARPVVEDREARASVGDDGDGELVTADGEIDESTDGADATTDGADETSVDGFARAPRQLLDQLRYLVNSRELTGEAPLPQTIALTSSMRGEGVTTISQGFAVVLTEDHDARVCWVDLSSAGTDVPDDAVDEAAPPGINDVLAGEVTLADAITVDERSGVSVLPWGSMQNRPAISYRSAQLDAAVAALGEDYDHIVFDMPPVLESSTALPLFRLAGAYLFVVRAGVTRRDQAARSTRQLSEVPLLGTVLNRQSTKIPAFLRRIGSD